MSFPSRSGVPLSLQWIKNKDNSKVFLKEISSRPATRWRFEPIFLRKFFISEKFSCKARFLDWLASKIQFLVISSQWFLEKKKGKCPYPPIRGRHKGISLKSLYIMKIILYHNYRWGLPYIYILLFWYYYVKRNFTNRQKHKKIKETKKLVARPAF